jgi:pimeloyl-ACP methyl ester carboxylesterase
MKRAFALLSIILVVPLFVTAAGCGGQKKENKEQTIFESAPLKTAGVRDIDIAYKEFGKGYPLVMITAFATTMDTWEPRFLEDLSAEYRVIVFDNRGMGKTTSGTADWTIDQFADDTAGLLDALGLKRANVLGWSIGGDIALSLVVYHPGKVNKLISYAGDCGGPQKVEPPPYKDTLQSVKGIRAPGSKVLAALFPPQYMQEHPLFATQFPWPKERSGADDTLKQLRAYNEWPGVYDELPYVKRPVLAATGTEDVSTPPENATIIANRIPGCSLARFSGAGHGLQYQYPHEFAKAIIDFLKMPGGKSAPGQSKEY